MKNVTNISMRAVALMALVVEPVATVSREISSGAALSTTATVQENGNAYTCSVLEGPHIELFDKAVVSLLETRGPRKIQRSIGFLQNSNKVHRVDDYQEGWLVKSAGVSIQAHFKLIQESPELTRFVLRAIAIGGDFLKDNKLVIGSFGDKITWNGRSILEDSTSAFNVTDILKARRSLQSSLVGDLSKENPGVNIELPLGVSLVVNRMSNHINVAIMMPPQDGGQDGLCGKLKAFPVGNELELASKKFDTVVAPYESLFANFPFD